MINLGHNHKEIMAGVVEELSKYHLWRWLDLEKGWDVYSEVQIEDGRVDLAERFPQNSSHT
jgi:hypothetical protein